MTAINDQGSQVAALLKRWKALHPAGQEMPCSCTLVLCAASSDSLNAWVGPDAVGRQGVPQALGDLPVDRHHGVVPHTQIEQAYCSLQGRRAHSAAGLSQTCAANPDPFR
jgi:hypothetical protein